MSILTLVPDLAQPDCSARQPCPQQASAVSRYPVVLVPPNLPRRQTFHGKAGKGFIPLSLEEQRWTFVTVLPFSAWGTHDLRVKRQHRPQEGWWQAGRTGKLHVAARWSDSLPYSHQVLALAKPCWQLSLLVLSSGRQVS